MTEKKRSGWWWIPSLYYAEGIPYIIVMSVSVIMYKRMGISNTDIALYTSWLYLPWVIKPFWSPVIDIFRSKRFWIITMQLCIGAGLGGVALTIPMPDYFRYTLLFFWLLAFSSATHDIAADGFYMLGLSQHDQAWFVGVRSTFYRFAMITGQGLLIIFAGFIENQSGLAAEDVYVYSDTAAPVVNFIQPDSLKIQSIENEQKILIYPRKLEISTQLRSRQEVDSIKQFIYKWNTTNGHIISEQKTEETLEQRSDLSGFQKLIENFERFIKTYFGQEKVVAENLKTGNIGIFYIRISRPPAAGDQIIVNFGRKAGDKSIALNTDPAAGSRLIFDKENWDKPAMAIIELDPKLTYTTEALFTAQSGNISLAWMLTFASLAILFLLFSVYHKIILPFPSTDHRVFRNQSTSYFSEFIRTFILFFKKDKIFTIISFLLLFRLAESQIVKLAAPFLLDAQESGGLALTTGDVGLVYGTVGLIALTFGGLLGGFLAARNGLRYWLWPMAIAINLPDLVYVYLSYSLPDSFLIINICIAIEQFGYGFGFTAYMLFMIYVSDGDHKTAHFAITTGFMALGMMIPGMISGYIQELIGYQHFFIWVMIATIPSFLIIKWIDVKPEFGKKSG